MVNRATPNLPSRDLAATAEFYTRLGFVEEYRDAGWLILTRDGATLEFFTFFDLDPATSSFGCCLRLDDVDAFFQTCVVAGPFPRIGLVPRGCLAGRLPEQAHLDG